MNAEDGPSLIWGIVMVLLLVSSLAARRLAIGQIAKMALAWIAIFAALFVVFSFRFELLSVWERVKSEFSGTSGQNYVGEAIEVKRQDDGHYWVRAQINGCLNRRDLANTSVYIVFGAEFYWKKDTRNGG